MSKIEVVTNAMREKTLTPDEIERGFGKGAIVQEQTRTCSRCRGTGRATSGRSEGCAHCRGDGNEPKKYTWGECRVRWIGRDGTIYWNVVWLGFNNAQAWTPDALEVIGRA
jgi:hypothetical protein